MPRRRPCIRYRVLLWSDELGNCDSVAVATYLDHEKHAEVCWYPEPFNDFDDCVRVGLRAAGLGEQLALPFE